MAKNSIEIKGLKELTKDLKKLPILMQAKILKQANRKAAVKNVEQPLIRAVPHKARKNKKRGKRPFTKKSEKQAITTSVKGSKTAVYSGISGYYFHYRFLEFGSFKTGKRKVKGYKLRKKRDRSIRPKKRSLRNTDKKGARFNRGRMPVTRPFAERILDKSINPLFRYLKTEYGKGIRKVLDKKLGK